jgi:hypothetical protein
MRRGGDGFGLINILRACDSQTKSAVLQRVKRWAIEYHAAPQPLEERLRSLGYRVERAKDLVVTGILYAYRPHNKSTNP